MLSPRENAAFPVYLTKYRGHSWEVDAFCERCCCGSWEWFRARSAGFDLPCSAPCCSDFTGLEVGHNSRSLCCGASVLGGFFFCSSLPARLEAVAHNPGRREARERSHLFLGEGDFTSPQSSQKAVAVFCAGHKCRHASGYTGQGVFVSLGTKLAWKQGWKRLPGVIRKVGLLFSGALVL